MVGNINEMTFLSIYAGRPTRLVAARRWLGLKSFKRLGNQIRCDGCVGRLKACRDNGCIWAFWPLALRGGRHTARDSILRHAECCGYFVQRRTGRWTVLGGGCHRQNQHCKCACQKHGFRLGNVHSGLCFSHPCLAGSEVIRPPVLVPSPES